MAYDKTNWKDDETLVNAQRLNKVEDGLEELSKNKSDVNHNHDERYAMIKHDHEEYALKTDVYNKSELNVALEGLETEILSNTSAININSSSISTLNGRFELMRSAVATNTNDVKFLKDNQGVLNALNTKDKTSLVNAINEVNLSGGGGQGTKNYEELLNLPKINNVTLAGDKTAEELNLVEAAVGNSTGIIFEDGETLQAKFDDGGIRGPKGEVGNRGEPGIQGVKGETGPMGPIGLKGDTGPQGLIGLKGDQGERGIQGLQGIPGAIGPMGPKGDSGIKGDRGEPLNFEDLSPEEIELIKGPIGPIGERGAIGPEGPIGPQGLQGDLGPEGLQGPQGPQGIQGDKGEQGSGLIIMGSYETEEELIAAHPTANPGEGFLVNGDLYYYDNENSKWINVGRIQGPKGDDGAPFFIYKTYATITEMEADFAGVDVPTYGFVLIFSTITDSDNAKVYIKDRTQWRYLTDMSGAQGIQGPKGDKGETGTPGPAGAQGTIGPQGPQGTAGPKGDNGVGLITGGTAGQVLRKKSATDFDTEWAIQEGGHTILNSGGTSFAQRNKMQFLNGTITDDAASGTTKIACPTTTIDNVLTSTSTTNALSANQGKILNDKLSNYLPLSGGSITGALNLGNVNSAIRFSGTNIIRNNGTATIISSVNDAVILRPTGDTDQTNQIEFRTNGEILSGQARVPHVFVQSVAPTAKAVGDIWFS